ncbi:hypothetical protein [Exiguobacterium sp. s133]|uniref:hypothetical protein n=1 Tax=Exiguobacterium sp. s133 TaxID=2751213 RepID=UPI001BE846E8|nr:hypothetical protein [Exiguobacterium sp. s133]
MRQPLLASRAFHIEIIKGKVRLLRQPLLASRAFHVEIIKGKVRLLRQPLLASRAFLGRAASRCSLLLTNKEQGLAWL